MNPNHYLAVAIHYLLSHRPQWNKSAAVGKTLVSSCLIDRVVERLDRKLFEVPVGFKWFSPGSVRRLGLFRRRRERRREFSLRDGTVWTTDKDGIILCLLAAEMIATTGRDAASWYEELTRRHGQALLHARRSAATAAQKNALKALQPDALTANELAGEPIMAKLTHAPGNGAAIGGLKVARQKRLVRRAPFGRSR